MSSQYLINTVTITQNNQPSKLFAGELISDPTVQANVASAGGVLGPATDTNLVTAAGIVTKMRQHGAGEIDCSLVMMAAFANTSYQATPQHLTIDIPLATIQTKTSGTAFNIGSVLPTNCKLLSAALNVLQTTTGGGATAVHATVQGGSDAAGSILGSTDTFTATGTFDTAGSDPYPNRSGQQLKMTLTETGGTLAGLTTGHLSVDIYYNVSPN